MSENETAVSEMYDTPVDVEAAKETLKRNLPPAGTYVSMLDEYEPTVTPIKFEGDDRQFFNVFIRAALKVRGGDTVEQGLRFKFSAETRPAIKFGTNEVIEGKDDAASKRYAELVQAYLAYYGGGNGADNGNGDVEPLRTLGQLVDFIKSVPLSLRTMQGDNGLQVVGVGYKKSR